MIEHSKIISFIDHLISQIRIEKTSLETKYYKIGDRLLKADFASFKWRNKFTDALTHLESSEEIGQSTFNLLVIDKEDAGINLPEPFWEWDQIDKNNGNILNLDPGYYAHCDVHVGDFTLVDLNNNFGIYWVNNASKLPEWRSSFPFRNIFYQWFKSSNKILCHAGAVGIDQDNGILITGKGGSGKSTSCLACLENNFLYGGDDFVMIDIENFIVYSLYNVAKLEVNNFKNFPDLIPHICNKEKLAVEKGQIFINKIYPHKVVHKMKLKAILLPKVTGLDYSIIKPAGKIDAIKALAPSSMWILSSDSSHISKMSLLINGLPCYWLESGSKIEEIGPTIKKFIRTLN
jgi:hypothetical protein